MAPPTIVLVPGLMNDGWVWHAQIGPLSRLAPLLVARTDGLDTLAGMAERILAAAAGPLLVAGHSMGGRVALELALRAPERVAGLALLSTGADGPSPAEAAGRERLVALARAEGMAAVAAAWLPPMLAPDTPAAMHDAIVAMLRRCPVEVFAGQQRALLRRPDRTGALATVAAPTLVATGALDRWSPPAAHAALAATLPNALLDVVAGAGHMLPIEAPAALAALLHGWAERCLDPGAR